jgi:uncharacterized protein YbaR (Trm112 family)
MRPETVEKLCCPFDRTDLNLTVVAKDIGGNIIEGFFTCKACMRIYPVVKGIPIMSPDEYREFKLEQPLLKRWEAHLNGKKVENFRMLS